MNRAPLPHLEPESEKLTPEEKTRILSMLAGNIYPGVSETVEVLAGGSVGTGGSAHDVFFAKADHPAGVVAIKRFSKAERAFREVDAIHEANRRGFRTFPLIGEGAYSLDDMGAALVTGRLSNFKTMNQVGWQNWHAGQPGYDDAAHTLQSIAVFMGGTHREGILAHDRQLKNIGQVPSGELVLFDLERAEFFPPGSNDPAFQDGCTKDIRDLTESLVEHGYLGTATDKVFTEELTSNVLDPYWEVHPSDTVIDSWDKTLENALFLRRQVRTGGQDVAGSLALVGAGVPTRE